MRALSALIALALLSGTPVATADSPPPPGLGVRLLDAPTARADDPRARVYIVDRVAPGASFTRHVEVSNGDRQAVDVLTYSAPATIHDGGFDVGNRTSPGDVPSWTTVTPGSLHLAPGQRSVVTVTVHIPRDAPSGEVYGAVVAERPPPSGATGVGVSVRAAIRMYLSVGPGGEPRSDFTVEALTAARARDGRPLVLAQVRNTGGRALDMSGTLHLAKGPGGLSAGPFAATLGTTLGIGQTSPVSVVLDKALPDGPWLATLDLHSGTVERSVQGTITFPAQAGTAAASVVPRVLPVYKRRSVVVPVAVGLLVLVLGLLLGWALTRRRRLAQ